MKAIREPKHPRGKGIWPVRQISGPSFKYASPVFFAGICCRDMYFLPQQVLLLTLGKNTFGGNKLLYSFGRCVSPSARGASCLRWGGFCFPGILFFLPALHSGLGHFRNFVPAPVSETAHAAFSQGMEPSYRIYGSFRACYVYSSLGVYMFFGLLSAGKRTQ